MLHLTQETQRQGQKRSSGGVHPLGAGRQEALARASEGPRGGAGFFFGWGGGGLMLSTYLLLNVDFFSLKCDMLIIKNNKKYEI